MKATLGNHWGLTSYVGLILIIVSIILYSLGLYVIVVAYSQASSIPGENTTLLLVLLLMTWFFTIGTCVGLLAISSDRLSEDHEILGVQLNSLRRIFLPKPLSPSPLKKARATTLAAPSSASTYTPPPTPEELKEDMQARRRAAEERNKPDESSNGQNSL